MALMSDLLGGNNPRLVGLCRDIKSGRVELLPSLTPLDGTRLTEMAVEEYWWNSYVPDPNPFNQAVINAQAAGIS